MQLRLNKYIVAKNYTCKKCNTVFTSRIPGKYCSRACFQLDRESVVLKKGLSISCKSCGIDFYAIKSRSLSANFCSTLCFNNYQGRNKVSIVCSTCGKVKRVSLCKHQQKYCSLECRNKNADYLNGLLDLNVKQQKNNTNKLEAAGYKMLKELGIKYTPQYIIANKFCVDAFIPGSNIVVQFDGDYWHGNAKLFPILSIRQKKRIALDKSQDAYLSKLGIKVVRIWENEMYRHKEEVENRIRNILPTSSFKRNLPYCL